MTISIKDSFQRAAGLIDGDLDEENLHLPKLGVAHFVDALRETETALDAKCEGKRLPKMRWLIGSPSLRFNQFCREGAVGKYDFEILVQAGSELFEADGGEIEHGKKFLTADDADCTDKNTMISDWILSHPCHPRNPRFNSSSWLTFC